METVPAAVALNAAFANAVAELEAAGISRKMLAGKLGIEPSTISRYVHGRLGVPIDFLPVLDGLLGKPKGHVLRLAGYVDDNDVDAVAAIKRDAALTDPLDRQALIELYRIFLRRSSSDSDSEPTPLRRPDEEEIVPNMDDPDERELIESLPREQALKLIKMRRQILAGRDATSSDDVAAG